MTGSDPSSRHPPGAGATVGDMKWLGEHIGDNRYVGAAFAVLIVVNAYAIAGGYYR